MYVGRTNNYSNDKRSCPTSPLTKAVALVNLTHFLYSTSTCHPPKASRYELSEKLNNVCGMCVDDFVNVFVC